MSDRQVVMVLRPFVRATGPMLDALRESDPLRVRARGAMSPVQRTTWWINRIGRITSLLTAIPGLGGALADRLPVQDAIGAASQGLLLAAIAGEYGVTDHAERVRLLAWVLFDRDVDPRLAAGEFPEHSATEEDVRTAELTEELGESKARKISLKAFARTLRRLGRSLLAITEELEKRPRGRLWHRLLGMLPVVGMFADYLGERSALKRVAKRARTWLVAHSHPARNAGSAGSAGRDGR